MEENTRIVKEHAFSDTINDYELVRVTEVTPLELEKGERLSEGIKKPLKIAIHRKGKDGKWIIMEEGRVYK